MADVGCDTSKDWIDVGIDGRVTRVARKEKDLDRAFAQLPPRSRVLVEPTGRYHRVVVERALRAGHEVKLVDPYCFSLYRRSLSPRASNDRICALALARFAEKEWERLPEYKEMPKHLRRLKDLLEMREKQVSLRVALHQSISEVKGAPASSKAAVKALERSVKDIDLEIFAIVQHDPLYKEFMAMDGVAEVTAPALVWLFRAFSFADSDQVVAFVGMDVRVRESGKFCNQRKMTKRGPALLRRLLCCAACSLRTIKYFQPLFAKHHAKGIRPLGVNVIVARRILRAAFHIALSGARYDRARFYTP